MKKILMQGGDWGGNSEILCPQNVLLYSIIYIKAKPLNQNSHSPLYEFLLRYVMTLYQLAEQLA